MRSFLAWAIRACVSRMRPYVHRIRRTTIALTSPGVEFAAGGQGISAGVLLRASDGGRIVIACDCQLSRGLEIVAQRGSVVIGAGTFIGPWTVITAKTGVTIGADCLIAERVTIRDQDHALLGPLEAPIAQAGFETAPIVIGDQAWVAAGAVILKGVTIGRGAVVAANAVVNRDVADFEIVGGVPARSIGKRGQG